MISDVHPPLLAVRDVVRRALEEDLLPLGDLTASLIDSRLKCRAAIVSRADGVIAGKLCVVETLHQVDPSLHLQFDLDDGDRVVAGSVVAELGGPLRSLLTAERTALNFLGQLSGVATLTRRYVDAVQGTSTRIWDTRKTTPGLRALEKAAVRAGGGRNHRGNLSEFVLVKDNHLGGMSITDAVARARDRWPGRVVEVECDRLEQVTEALAAGAGMVLLDNMSTDEVKAAVAEVAGRVPVEVSGGVTLETVRGYAEAGADLISVGALTNSAPVLDVGLDLGD
jgi:nicotinate-nucleotide pyrophosphorylase (carboxylating)